MTTLSRPPRTPRTGHLFAGLTLLALAALLAPRAAGRASAAAAVGPLVSTAWLAQHLAAPDLVLLHVGERRGYDAEHIPGARFVELRDISTGHVEGGLALELPSPDTLRARLERLGISDDSRVVVYYGSDWVSPATRVIFTLDAAGLGDRTALLDGGMPQWKRDGRAVTAQAAAVKPGRLTPRAYRPLVVDHAYVKGHLKTRGVAIVDARAPVFYDGPPHGEHRPGHIPGAVNIPFSSVADDSLHVLPKPELERLFRSAGVQPGDTVVAYCHVGQQATAVIFAARLLGHPARLYDGSFEDWSRRAELPVERGKQD